MAKDAANRSKQTPPDGDGCWNCKFSSEKNGRVLLVCQPDLPPMLKVSDNPNHYTVHPNYRCYFWTPREIPKAVRTRQPKES